MKTVHQSKSAISIAATASLGLALLTNPARAELILLEQFDYEGVDTPLNGFDGGMGFEGGWLVTGWSRNYDIGRTAYANGTATTTNDRGGLEFEGLPTAGSALGRFGTAGQRQAQRELTAASQAALTADNTTIWFSVLAGPPSNGNKYGTLIFATDPMIATQGAGDNANLSADGQGFGVGFRLQDEGAFARSGTGSPNAVAFIDSSFATVSEGSYIPPITEPATHHDTSLIVGKINWKPDGTEDELFLFNMATGEAPEPAEVDAIASLSADFEQSTFTLLSLQDTGSTIYDEIRFGTSFGDVTSGAPASPFTITDIVYAPAAGKEGPTVTLTWKSRPGEIYIVSSSLNLSNWSLELEDGIEADPKAEQTSSTFDLRGFNLQDEEKLFFRVEKQ